MRMLRLLLGGNDRKISRAAVAASDHAELIQAALERAVIERDPACRLQPNELRQPQVGGEEVAAPAGKTLFQRVAKQGVEACELLVAARAFAIGRVRDEHARVPRCGSLEDVGALEPDALAKTCC